MGGFLFPQLQWYISPHHGELEINNKSGKVAQHWLGRVSLGSRKQQVKHCFHMSLLPVSIIACTSFGGLPIRY
jgi:hypothetical protein